jgi:hypothetical protein
MCWMTQDLMAYCASKAYHDDYAEACPTTPLMPSQRAGIFSNIRGTRNGSGASSMTSPVTIHEVDQGVKQGRMFYHVEKDGKDSVNGMKMLPQSLKWIVLTMFSMNIMFPRMLKKKLFGRNTVFICYP